MPPGRLAAARSMACHTFSDRFCLLMRNTQPWSILAGLSLPLSCLSIIPAINCAKNIGVVRALEQNLKVKVRVPPEPQIIAALGAAICAQEMAGE